MNIEAPQAQLESQAFGHLRVTTASDGDVRNSKGVSAKSVPESVNSCAMGKSEASQASITLTTTGSKSNASDSVVNASDAWSGSESRQWGAYWVANLKSNPTSLQPYAE